MDKDSSDFLIRSVHEIGDAKESRTIYAAISDAYEVVNNI